MRIINGGDGLIAAGVAHAGPGISTIGHGDAELEGAEACLRFLFGLQVVLDLLINGDVARPTGRITAAAHDVALHQLVAGEQAAHAAHVAVAIATDFVGDAMEDEGLLFEGFERLQDGAELELGSSFLRPELLGQGAIGREHDDQPLTALRSGSAGDTGQSGQEGQCGSGDAQVAEELAAMEMFHGGN